MGDPKKNLMAQFKNRYYTNDVAVELLPNCDDPEYMQVIDPVTLASFVAFCSVSSHQVFLRGSTNNYENSIPTLFRSDHGKQREKDECYRLWSAYRTLLNKLRSQLPGSRWDRDNLGAVLQHYGFRTPWLDIVRNLYTAIWLATHSFETRGCCRVARRTMRQHGWISFYGHQQDGLICDLWDEHSSLHVRPHVQQAMSLALQGDPTANDTSNPVPDQNLNHYRIAQVCFPHTSPWKFSGYMFSARFLFPAPEYDTSLQELGRPVVEDVLGSVCLEYNLDGGALGNVTHYM